MSRIVVAGLLLLAGTAGAAAHAWYPVECCSERDCAPHDAGEVEEHAAGFALKSSGEFVPRSEARPSPDEDFHLCRAPASGRLLCFFIPNRGS